VRDAVLCLSGQLELTMGGPELEEGDGETSGRRSLYFRHTPDSQVQFLTLFDAANASECYQRNESVVPQQALAMTNSVLSQSQARLLARRLDDTILHQEGDPFVVAAYECVLGRSPTDDERQVCDDFLRSQAEFFQNAADAKTFATGPVVPVKPASDPKLRARENLILVLFNHNEFVTIR